SLQVFEKARIKNLREKSLLLTGYLTFLLNQIDNSTTSFSVITPDDPKQRGCQLSILMHQNGKSVFQKLTKAGIIADWREPGVIRVAPVPLYNRFEDVFKFVKIFKASL
ncbi:MAG: kynureninase, partial [Cytophagales bacterium]|nr:kynureninase [Cytophagales bacterium]